MFFSSWFNSTKYSLEEHYDWTKAGEPTWCKLLMTYVTQLKTRLSPLTLNTSSSRRAIHGQNQFLSAMIEASELTEYSNVSWSRKVLASRRRACPRWQSWSAQSINSLARMKCTVPNTNLTESNAQTGSIKKEKPQRGKPGYTKMQCNVNLTRGPFSLSAKATRLSFLSHFQIWTAS